MTLPSQTNVTHQYFHVVHTVDFGEDGVRLDQFLSKRLKKRSRANIQRAILDGRITIQRSSSYQPLGRVKPSFQLLVGDRIHIHTSREPEPAVSFDYEVLFQDETLLVVNKPANLPVHPAGRFYFHTLLVHLRTDGFSRPLEANREFYLAHRIDKDTSGVLILCRESDACAAITLQFRERQTKKRYLALVHGTPSESEFVVTTPIGRSKTSLIRIKMGPLSVEEGGLPSETRFKVLETKGKFSLVECFPKTGRQHQIRVHLASVGHPIVGDKLYSIPDEQAVRFFEADEHPRAYQYLSAELASKLYIPRHALHAAGIEFAHPVSGERLQFDTYLPKDLRAFFENQECQIPLDGYMESAFFTPDEDLESDFE